MGAACTALFCGRPDLGAKLFRHRAGAVRRGSRLQQRGRRALLCLWEARPRGEAFPAPSRRRSPRVAPPTRAAACTALFFVGGPTSGRSFFRHRAGAVRRGSRLPQWGGVHCFVFCGRPDLGAKLFQTPSRRRSPWGATPTIAAACTALFFVGGPTSGRSFSDTEPAPFAAGRASHDRGGVHCFVFCERPDLGAKLFQTPSRPIRRGSRLPQWRRVARFLWEGRLFGPQPMVIRLALPPAAAVLMLSARSISKRSSGISVSPGAMPCMPTMGPLRRARCWLTSRNWSGLP